jgi:quercetin dioxygenase-like cupin family protein
MTSDERDTMKILSGVLAAGVAMAALAQAQSPAPANKGVVIVPVGVVDLGPEIDGMAGRQLRARRVTVEPGGTIAHHSHKDRPSAEVLIEGRLIEYRNGVAVEHGPGDWIFSDKTTNHSWENKGSVPAVLLPVDVFKP